MRAHFHWTKETAFTGWTLRDSKGLARAIVTELDNFYFGQLFTRGMPSSNAYARVHDAAAWVTRELLLLDLVPKDSAFRFIDDAEAA